VPRLPPLVVSVVLVNVLAVVGGDLLEDVERLIWREFRPGFE